MFLSLFAAHEEAAVLKFLARVKLFQRLPKDCSEYLRNPPHLSTDADKVLHFRTRTFAA